jgi:hypothetical protein
MFISVNFYGITVVYLDRLTQYLGLLGASSLEEGAM